MLGPDHESESERGEHGSEEEGGRRPGRPPWQARYNPYVQRLDRGRGAAPEPRAGVRVRARRLRPARTTASARRSRSSTTRSCRRTSRRPPSRSATRPSRCARRPRSRSGGGFGRLLLLGIVGAGVALALSEGLRKKVLDALFGAEEEFEYTSTTSSPRRRRAGHRRHRAPSPTPAGPGCPRGSRPRRRPRSRDGERDDARRLLSR